MKYKVGDKVRIKSLDWYNENKDEYGYVRLGDYLFTPDLAKYCGEEFTISHTTQFTLPTYVMIGNGHEWSDEMIEGLVEEETPKFKIDDIVFVKNIGWVRITNSYWDSLANEYIYEAIGFNGEGEYDSINQSNIECQMLPESENPHTRGNKITFDEYKNNDKEWLFNKLAMLDNITALESIQDIFNHFQQPKYPKTYEECCKIMDIDTGFLLTSYDLDFWKGHLLTSLQKLLICRDAYWKLYGEEMGLGKLWEPDWNDISDKYCIYFVSGDVWLKECQTRQCLFAFPTEEMRDAFYENFKDLIKKCKELL